MVAHAEPFLSALPHSRSLDASSVRSADDGSTIDANGVIRDAKGNVIGADPNNPNIAKQVAQQKSDADFSAIGKNIGGAITSIIGAVSGGNQQQAPSPPPDNTKRNIAIALVLAAVAVFVYKHRKKG